MSDTLIIGGTTYSGVPGIKATDSGDNELTFVRPTGTKQISITENGTTTEDVAAYASAEITVNVSGGGGSNPKIVLTYTLAEDFTATSTTTLATITGGDLQTFFDTYLGTRGNFPVGTHKKIHVDVKSDVQAPSDYSYLVHYGYDVGVAFGATSQAAFIESAVLVIRNSTAWISQGALYTLHPTFSSLSGNVWTANIIARCSTAPFDVYKAGIYTMTIEYLGEFTNA